jgi:hypothetical protein
VIQAGKYLLRRQREWLTPAFMPRLAFMLRANVDTGHMDVQIPVFAIYKANPLCL